MRYLFAAFLCMLGGCLADRGNSLCQELAAARQAVATVVVTSVGVVALVGALTVAILAVRTSSQGSYQASLNVAVQLL